MDREHSPVTDRPLAASLISRAVAAGTPRPVAADAMRVVRRRFACRGAADGPLSARAQAYFWGVIRRRALQGAAPAVSRLLVIASLERELREAGHSPEAIRSEVARLHGTQADALLGASEIGSRALA